MADQEILTNDALVPANAAGVPQPFRLTGGFSDLRNLTRQPAVQRALPAIAGVSALALAAAAWWGLQSPAQRPLFEGLAENDKAAVTEALSTASIAYSINRDTGSITVGEDDVHKARILLAGQGLPKAAPAGDAMIAALPLGSSRAVEGETLRGAREADLARTIEAIDAVKSARVHLATPEPSIFVRDNSTPAASVMLTLQPGRTLSEAQVRAIRHLVASSVPSMRPDEVAVIDQSGALLSQQDANGDNAAFQLQLQMEDRYRQALTALLAPMVGQGNFTAELHVDMDPSESQSTRETYPKDDRALRREEGNKTSAGAATPPAVGIPGALSNQPPQATTVATQPGGQQTVPAAAAGAAAQSAETFNRSFDVGREISVTHQPVGRVRRLSVAVAIRDPQGAKPRSKAEMAALDALVKGAVGFDAARGDVVAISSRAFVDPEAATVSWWDRPLTMMLLRQGGALLVALLILFFVGKPMLAGLRKRKAARDEANALEEQLLSATRPNAAGKKALGSASDADRNRVTLDMIEAAPSYSARADLVRDFVRQDPERAAVVVRQLVKEGADA